MLISQSKQTANVLVLKKYCTKNIATNPPQNTPYALNTLIPLFFILKQFMKSSFSNVFIKCDKKIQRMLLLCHPIEIQVRKTIAVRSDPLSSLALALCNFGIFPKVKMIRKGKCLVNVNSRHLVRQNSTTKDTHEKTLETLQKLVRKMW